MPSQPPGEPWGFGPALDLIGLGQDGEQLSSPSARIQPPNDDCEPRQPSDKAPTSLGDFASIFRHLDAPKEPLFVVDQETEDNSHSDDAVFTPPDNISSHSDVADDPSDTEAAPSHSLAHLKLAEDPLATMTKKQQYKARMEAEKLRKQEREVHKQELLQKKKQAKYERRKIAIHDTIGISDVAKRTRSKVAAMFSSVSSEKQGFSERAQETPSKLVSSSVPNHVEVPSSVAKPRQGSGGPVPPLYLIQRSGVTPIGDRRTGNFSATSPSPVACPPTREDVTSFPFPVQGGKRNGSSNNGINPALEKLGASLQTQYTTFGTPIPVQPLAPLPTVWGEKADLSKPRHKPTGENADPFNTRPMSTNSARFPTTPGRTPHTPGLVPLTIRPVPTTNKKLERKKSTKVNTMTRASRNFEFLKKLIERFPEDQETLVSPRRMVTSEQTNKEGIHVFVDASNILIGFNEMLKRRNFGRYHMSFDCLALLLERRRLVAKRVYAGSNRTSAPIDTHERFNDLAGEVGYERHIYEQVHKIKDLTDSQKFFRDVDKVGWQKATAMRSPEKKGNSESETGAGDSPLSPVQAPKWVEQGVDEALHLKMCQSIIDWEVPSTMVLATGDGAQAEYSDGFLAHVERALKKGWCVEVVSWKQQLSSGYKKAQFREKWGDRFKVIELDDFIEYMVDADA